jgi:lysophospholipase L1-like esterase
MSIRAKSGRLAIVLLFATAATLIGTGSAQAAGAYTALGDSYTSGVGTREYYPDSGSCYRSRHAYPVLAAARNGSQLTFAACSGAVVADVRNNQLGSLNAATAAVSVQVGGNDAGFTSVLTACARPWPWTCWAEIDEANRIIRDERPGRLNGLYAEIRSRAPNAKVVVVGYPRIFNGEECNAGSRISPGEQAELNKTADLLASTIGARAAAHGFAFVDVRTAFNRHAVCDDVEWINGLSNPIRESYHPNQAGQRDGFTPLVAPQVAAVGVPAWT